MTTKTIHYIVDTASGGADLCLWANSRAEFEHRLQRLVDDGLDPADFELGAAVVPADYDGGYRPNDRRAVELALYETFAREFESFLDAHPHLAHVEGDAQDMLASADLTADERAWLRGFADRWAAALN